MKLSIWKKNKKKTTNKTTKLSETLWDHCKNHFMMLLVTIAHHRTCYSILMVLTLPFQPLFNRSKGHGSGCTTALSGMHRYLYRVYCLTPPTSRGSDNTQNLHSSTVERIPKYPHPRPKVNVLATFILFKERRTFKNWKWTTSPLRGQLLWPQGQRSTRTHGDWTQTALHRQSLEPRDICVWYCMCV